MKKSYLLMAAAATMFAACSETDFVQEVNTQQAISFEGFAGKTTRAEITDEVGLQGVGFLVWGYTGSTIEDVVFDGDNVVWDNVKGIWNYADGDTDLKYWDASKTYSFYAVAPASADATCTSLGVYRINNVVSGKASEVADYLTADAKTGIAGSYGQQVNFDFNHVMSKVSVVLATTADDVTVHSVEMTGWNNAVGRYVYDDEDTQEYIWLTDAPVAGTAVIYDALETYIDASDSYVNNYTDIDDVETDPYLIVPQGVTTLRFTLTYKVGDVLFTENYVEIADQEWEINEHTTYTLNIGAGPITFGVSSVDGWEPATPAPDVPAVQ